jgi:undecaprenyl-diphosphatase
MTPMQAFAGAFVLGAAGLALAASPYDAQILMRLRHPDDPAEALGPVWLQESIRDITALGSNTVLAIVLLLAALTLGLLGKVRRAGAAVVSAAAALSIVNLLKIVFARDRPDVLSELPVLSASFPSSHAMMSGTIYLMLGLMAAEAAERQAIRQAAVAAARAVVLATGLSRIYLGVHWPSDVLAGWALGLVWAVASALLLSSLAERGWLEPIGTKRSAAD